MRCIGPTEYLLSLVGCLPCVPVLSKTDRFLEVFKKGPLPPLSPYFWREKNIADFKDKLMFAHSLGDSLPFLK